MKQQLLPLSVLCALAAAIISPARADQLIQIPTANIAAPTLEYKHRLNDGKKEGYATLFAPVGTSYEVMARYFNHEDGQDRAEGGAMFQLLPDGVITPGIAVGMWDITNSSRWGRRAFFVVTKSLRPGQFFIPKPLKGAELTLGAGTGRFSGVLGGLKVNLPAKFSLVAEYDSHRLNAGLWYNPVKPVKLKYEFQNGNPYVGGDLSWKF